MFKIGDDNSSPIASISCLLWKLVISRSPNKSTDLSYELKTDIGCDPSTVFCKKEKPDVPACNSKYKLTLGLKLFHRLCLWETLMIFD